MFLMLLWLNAAAAGEWRASLGAELNADTHGTFDLGYRQGDWAAELLTDTLELRYAPDLPRGRWWIAGRAEARIADLTPFPWQDGAPAPELGFWSSYAGGHGGWIRYLPRGLYAGVQADARAYRFLATADTAVPLPSSRRRIRAELVGGWWTEPVQVYATAGVQNTPGVTAPHAQISVSVSPGWRVAPLVQGWAGWGAEQDFLTRTRMGGLNPYVVPLAGAAWAEWWAEDYAVLRAGPQLNAGPVAVSAVGDVGWSDASGTVWGLGLLGRVQPARWFLETSAGYGAGVERAAGVSPVSVWILWGLDWGGQPSG